MKIKYFLLLLTLLFNYTLFSQSDIDNYYMNHYFSEILKVEKIKKKKNIYIIYASNDSLKYKIVSKRISKDNDCKRIRKNRTYLFKLYPVIKGNNYIDHYLTHVKIDDVFISLDYNYGDNIYIVLNTNGLCYSTDILSFFKNQGRR